MADAHLASNFCKLAAYTCAGWVFLTLFEELSWVLLIALIIPFVDAISVAAGPTHDDRHAPHRGLLGRRSRLRRTRADARPGSGRPTSSSSPSSSRATVRWRLRPVWTWLAMTGMYSLTLVIANATDVNGLPALPFLSFGFLVANGDLLWRRLRPRQA